MQQKFGVCILSSVSVAGAPVGIIKKPHKNNKKVTKYDRKQKEKAWWNCYVG